MNKFYSGELIVSNSNFLSIRKKMGNIAMLMKQEQGEILLEATLTKAIVDSYNYFNTQYNDAIIEMVVSEITEIYGMHSLFEVLQAIKTGKRKQEKIYGKLSPAHILDWVRDFDNDLNPMALEFSEVKSRISSGNRSDKYEQPMTNAELEIFKKLAEKYVKAKKKERSAKEKLDDIYLKHLENEKKIAEYNKNPEKYGDFDEYMKL